MSTTSSRIDYNDESDDEPRLVDKTKYKTYPVEFGGLLGNIILTILLPLLVILSKIAIKAVINIFKFHNFPMILILLLLFVLEGKFDTFSSRLFKIS